MKQRILKSAVSGLSVWLAYGMVEFALAYGSHRPLLLLTWQWKLLALMFGAYALLGSLLGAGIGALLAMVTKRDGRLGDSGTYDRTTNRTAAALTLVLAFAVNLMRGWPLPRQEYIALAVAVALAGVFLAALASHVWLERIAFLANPWFLALLLLVSPWASFEVFSGRTGPVRKAASLLLIGAIMVAAAIWHRWQSGQIPTPFQQFRTLGIAMGIVCVGVMALQWDPALTTTHASFTSMPGKCNVLLITMDTVRADHLPMYGYTSDTTPHLREFAREATLYHRAIAAADMTLPAHASIFTGLYPGWHGAYLAPPAYPGGRPLPQQDVTLAQLLQENGYRTAAVVANWAYLNERLGLAKGFGEYDSHRPVQLANSERPFYLSTAIREMLGLAVSTDEFDARVLRAEDINQRALAWLSRTDRGGPFFLFLNYMDAHVPYIPESPFDSRFPGKDRHFTAWTDYENVRRAVLRSRHNLSEPEKRHFVSQYDGGIAYMDLEIAKLLDELRARRLYDNTLIIITSDHGEAFGEHNLMEHATGFLYQDQVHVPLFIKYPGQHEAQESNALASEVDLMPTVLDVATIPSPQLQGRTLRSPRSDSEPVYAEDRNSLPFLAAYPRFRGVRRTIFSGYWKLVTWTAGAPELYDLSTDPAEEHNLYRPDEPHAIALLDRMNAWTATIPPEPAGPGVPRAVDKPNLEKLKSLGYVQ